MTIYLIKGYLGYAATTLADAQALLTALANPALATNQAAIDRITDKLETLVQGDTGEPIVLSSIDDTAGTYSAWITDASTTLALGLGDPDPSGNTLYASTLSSTISGNTRLATLALNTTALAAAVNRGRFLRLKRGVYLVSFHLVADDVLAVHLEPDPAPGSPRPVDLDRLGALPRRAGEA